MKPERDAQAWDASAAAVTTAWIADASGRRVAALSHPSFPFHGQLDLADADADGDKALFAFANRYVEAVGRAFADPAGASHDVALHRACQLIVADANQPDRPDANGFGWLRIGWGSTVPEGRTDPRRSFWVERFDGDRVVERTAVLLAAMRVSVDKKQICLGGGIGLRVTIHVDTRPTGTESRYAARVTGLTAAGLARIPESADVASLRAVTFVSLLNRAPRAAESTFGFVAGTASVTAAWLDPQSRRLWLAGSGLRDAGDMRDIRLGLGRVFEWAGQADWDDAAPETLALRGHVVEQASAATAILPVFVRDPASAGGPGPTAAEDRLESTTLRKAVPVQLPLCDGAARFEVRQSVVADKANDASLPQDLTAADIQGLSVRSDAQSAVHAFVRAQELFDRLECYGLRATQYFKFASLPLVLRHRAWFYEQPDGLAVNAQVRPDRWVQSLHEDYQPGSTPQLEVRLGAADLAHRALRPNDHGCDRAQPLGIAADPRIAWHEFGHVLSHAATGALEFHFAHSAGDSLAAILADPDSSLAAVPACRGRSDAPAGQTYPWVGIARRHDREARLGWCWCGQRNAMRHVPFRLPAPLFKDYIEEQLLSSTLFRLYRALGGDTFSDSDRRRAAADYSAYLVMKAIALLGPAAVVPVIAAEQFFEALCAADAGTFAWAPQVPSGGSSPPTPRTRQGGTAHKVIRWAFEQQGLFATDDPTKNVEGVGRPPKVDLFIAGRGERSGGGYSPVELVWSDNDSAAWHADGSALWLSGSHIVVHVRNRGSTAPGAVKARAWVAAMPAQGAPLHWAALPAPVSLPVSTLPADVVAAYQFDTIVGGHALKGRYFVLAAVDCLDDRSNLDPSTLYECATPDPPAARAALIDLVANDNNLGMRLFHLH